jgi:hypothetical protein
MPSFQDTNPTFDNAPVFERPPAEHPYWVNEVSVMQKYGFSREFLVTLAEVDREQNGRLIARLNRAIKKIEQRCEPPEEEVDEEYYYLPPLESDDYVEYEPQYIANTLMRRLNSFYSNRDFNEAENLLQYLIETSDAEFDQVMFDYVLFMSYHPDNRMIMAFKPGVREDGTIVDAAGPASQHPGFVDERGRLLDLTFISRSPRDLFSG